MSNQVIKSQATDSIESNDIGSVATSSVVDVVASDKIGFVVVEKFGFAAVDLRKLAIGWSMNWSKGSAPKTIFTIAVIKEFDASDYSGTSQSLSENEEML